MSVLLCYQIYDVIYKFQLFVVYNHIVTGRIVYICVVHYYYFVYFFSHFSPEFLLEKFK